MTTSFPAEPSPDAIRQEEQLVARKGADAESVSDVVTILEQLQTVSDRMPPRLDQDGIACFTRLYTTITKAVLADIDNKKFANTLFIAQLDVIFAKRYLSALSQQAVAPACWGILLARGAAPDISPIHFAAAGVNAHVNFDLPIALVATCSQFKLRLGTDNQHESYQQVNAIFREKMQALITEFATPDEDRLDVGVMADAVNRVGDLAVCLSRDVAWMHAERLSVLAPEDSTQYQTELDRFTSLASRGILARDPLL